MGPRARTRFSRVVSACGLLLLVGCGDDNPSSTPDVTQPGRVMDLRASQRSATSAVVRWTATGDDDAVGQAASYDLRRSPIDITLTNWRAALPQTGLGAPKASGEPESLIVSGLTEGVRYYFALRVTDEAGNQSRLSNTAGLTIDVTPPGIVDSVEAQAVDDSSVRLSWVASGDDGAEGVATAYDLRYALTEITEATWASAVQVAEDLAPQPSGTHESTRVSGLQAATTYWFAVKSIDEEGNTSALSEAVQATTLP